MTCAFSLGRVARTLQFSYVLVASLSAVAAANANTRSMAQLRPIVLSGQLAPGTTATFSQADYFVANRLGDVAFRATLTSGDGINASNNSGLWTNSGGQLTMIARTDELAPGAPAGMKFIRFDDFELNSYGVVAFHAHWTGSGNDRNEGIWKTQTGGLQLIARTDAPAPGVVPSAEAGLVAWPSLNDAGDIAYGGHVGQAGGVGRSASWFSRDGNTSLAAIEGAQAPGMPDGYTFDLVGVNPIATEKRNLIFTGLTNLSYYKGIWRLANGQLTPIVTPFTLAPGVPVGMRLSVGTLSVNRPENLAFNGYIHGGTDSLHGLWRLQDDELELVAIEGEQAPGTPSGTTFEFLFGPHINDRGDVVFDAGLTLGQGMTLANRGGIWFTDGGQLKYLMRYGDQAPGTVAGTKFGNGTFAGSPSSHAINNRRQIAFFSTLQLGTGDATQANNAGIWAMDANGDLQLIVRHGDLIEVSAGDFRTVSNLSSGFHVSERGDILFAALFTDGTRGLFSSSRVAVLDGDYNFDGIVDAADYTVWRNQMATGELDADGNYDGEVDDFDYQVWKANYGYTRIEVDAGAIAQVPEPASLMLAFAAAVVFAHRRWR